MSAVGDENNKYDAVYEAIQVEYQQMASWYDWFWKSYLEGTLKIPLNEVLKQIQRRIGSTSVTLVDVGCGTGAFLRRLVDVCPQFITDNRHLSNTSFKLIGIEPSKEMLQQAQKKFNNKEDDVVLKRSPAEHLPLGDSSADIIVSTSAFHFFRDKDRSLQEMKRVLKKDGTLIITDWCNDYWIVKLYHIFERIRWNWRFNEKYPSPLTSSKLTELVSRAGFCQVKSERYRVRVFSIFFWGMQTVSGVAGKMGNSLQFDLIPLPNDDEGKARYCQVYSDNNPPNKDSEANMSLEL